MVLMKKYRLSSPDLRPRPASFKRPTKKMILGAARRFAKDGELSNAVEMLRLVYPDMKMLIRNLNH